MDAAREGTESGLQPPPVLVLVTAVAARVTTGCDNDPTMTVGSHIPDAAAPFGVVALSGPSGPDIVEQGLGWLRDHRRPVVAASNLSATHAFLAGRDDERLNGLEEVLDGGSRVILPVRGGYGVTRILHRLPWERLADGGVSFVGYSDVTPILNHLATRTDVIQVHGPMLADLVKDHEAAARLDAILDGELAGRALFEIPPEAVLRPGVAEGRAMGGNLCLLASLAGTPHQPDLSGSVLFLEEVNEAPYRLDRLLTQIGASGMFREVKALILGDLSGFSPRREDPGDVLAATLLRAVSGPVVHGLPFGHGKVNHAFPIGAVVGVNTDHGEIVWRV
jgi:muramoyltetrapeptide carboxypeptidase